METFLPLLLFLFLKVPLFQFLCDRGVDIQHGITAAVTAKFLYDLDIHTVNITHFFEKTQNPPLSYRIPTDILHFLKKCPARVIIYAFGIYFSVL